MKIRYIINSDGSTYVEYDINLITKYVHFKLVESGIELHADSEDIRHVLNIEPSFNPHVQLAKKGLIWDFHIFKQDAYGKEHRAILSVTTVKDYTPIHVELVNDGTKDLVLKNYSIHSLDDYNPGGSKAPEDVSNLTTTLDDTGVMIEWINPSYEGFTGINLYRTNTFTNERVELIKLPQTMTSFYDTPLPAAGNYFYEARTFNRLNIKSFGVGVTQEIVPKQLIVDSLADVSFAIDVLPQTDMLTISVNPTWTFARKSTMSDEFTVRYVNAKTSEDLILPDTKMVGGQLVFKNESFAIGTEENYSFTVKQLDNAGAVIDTDTIEVTLTSSTSGIDRTKVTGLVYNTTGDIQFNPIHQADTSVKYYHLYINAKLAKRFAITDLPSSQNKITLYKLMDFSSENVISLAVSKDGTNVYGQAEITYIPYANMRAVADWKDPYPTAKAANNNQLKGNLSVSGDTIFLDVEYLERKYGLEANTYEYRVYGDPFGVNALLTGDVIRNKDTGQVTFIVKGSELIAKGMPSGIINIKILALKHAGSSVVETLPSFSVIGNVTWDGSVLTDQDQKSLNV